MAKPSPLIVLSVVATAMVNLTTHRAIEAGNWHEGAKGLLLGFSIAQLVLLTLWLVYGSWNLLARLLIILAMFGFLAHMNASVTHNTDLDDWLGAITLVVFVVATPLTILRLLGMTWVSESGRAKSESTGLQAHRGQFSLGTLLVWVTGFCIVLGVMRGIGFPWRDVAQVIVHCLGFSVVGLLSLWAVFSGRYVAVRLSVVAVASPMIGWLMGLPWPDPLFVSVICGVEMLGSVFGASVLRMSGLQLGWPIMASRAAGPIAQVFEPSRDVP